jgi:O-6-methylguanine DNA methyltransferase
VTAEAWLESPVGLLKLGATARGLHELSFNASRPEFLPESNDAAGQAIIDAAIEQLLGYFAGALHSFDLPLDIQGSDFQKRVWSVISDVPYGATISYGELAAAAGSDGAYRAAGAACGANKLAIVIPCHRILGSNRTLHGFGGGLHNKAWLLRHEGAAFAGKYAQPTLELSRA